METNDAQDNDSAGQMNDPFSIVRPTRPELPILVAVPHAGREYPAALRQGMREPDATALKLEDRLVDRVAQEVAEATGASLLVAHAPRAQIDLNRSVEDVDWSMIADAEPRRARHSIANRRSRSGLGLVPRRLPGLGEIWKTRISRAELDRRIAQVHLPYHRALTHEMATLRDRWGACLLLDFHSMPPLPRRFADEAVAQFVVGDRFGASCDAMLAARALNYLSAREHPVAHNRPYSGGYVLEQHGAPKRGLHAMQLEICRSTYLDPEMRELSPRLAALSRLLAGLVLALAEDVQLIGAAGGQAVAAE